MRTAEQWLDDPDWCLRTSPTTGNFTAYGIEAIQKEAIESPRGKVVQLSTHIDAHGRYLVLALTSTGHIWQLEGLYEGEPSWKRFPIPPQL